MAQVSDDISMPGEITEASAPPPGESQTIGGSRGSRSFETSSVSEFSKEIEALKQKLVQLEIRQAQINPETPTEPPIDSRMQIEMEQFKRMESCLYKHRKEWEINEGPGEVFPDFVYSQSRIIRSENGAWFTSERGLRTEREFKRPDIFSPTHECDADGPRNGNSDVIARDNYDDIIDWADRRDRLRKSFEWDLDRMYLGEELQRKRLEKKRAEEDRERRERRMAESGAPNNGEQNANAIEAIFQGANGPDLVWLDWYPFKTSSKAGENSVNVVEILIGEPVTDDSNDTPEYWFGASAQPTKKATKQQQNEKSFGSLLPASAAIPERIRIRSDPLLRIFSAILGSDARSLIELKEMEAVFLRPYKALVYREKALRDWCKALERKFRKLLSASDHSTAISIGGTATEKTHKNTSVEDNVSQSSLQQPTLSPTSDDVVERVAKIEPKSIDATTHNAKNGEEDEYEEDKVHDLTRSLIALAHLRCLLRFIDSNIVAKRSYLNSPECRKVFFSDLWHIFRPGVEVISSDGKQAYKIIGVSSAKHRVASRWEQWYDSTSNRQGIEKLPDLSLICVYVDFDGVNIGPVRKNFEFHRFDGQRDITSLEVYPLNLYVVKESQYTEEEWMELGGVPVNERYRKKLVQRGARFLDVVRGKHMYYAGMTLETKDEVESPVVIDFETTFIMHDKPPKTISSQENNMLTLAEQRQRQRQIEEENMNNTWKPTLVSLMDTNEESFRVSKVVCSGECCRDEFVHDDQYVDGKQMAAYIESLLPPPDAVDKHPPIIIMPRPMRELQIEQCSDEELVIMSYRVFGFILRSRKFGMLLISLVVE